MKSTITLQLDVEHDENIPTAIEFAIEVAQHLNRPGIMRTQAKVITSAVERRVRTAPAPTFRELNRVYTR